jgi:hypothetical protein
MEFGHINKNAVERRAHVIVVALSNAFDLRGVE